MVDIIEVASEEETAAVAARLGESLAPGSVVLLFGDLGAGKTAFVRGMAPAFGIDPDHVSSPTFALLQPYVGPAATLYHLDLYRLDESEVDELGLEDLSAESVLVVEWAERWPGPIASAIRVHLTDLGGERRRISIERPEPDDRS